jgi:hypothetical protein
MLLGGYALLTVAAALAWVLSRRAAEHRAVALLLTVYLFANIGRRALVALILAPAHLRFDPEPLAGWAEVAVHVDTALFLAPRAMLAAVAVAVFAPPASRRRSIIGVAAAWAITVTALVALYPITRGSVLARCYLAAELAALIVSVGVIATWIRARRVSELQHVSVALLVAAELVITFAGPWRTGIFASWSGAQAVYSTLFALLAVLQGGSLWLPRDFSGSD